MSSKEIFFDDIDNVKCVTCKDIMTGELYPDPDVPSWSTEWSAECCGKYYSACPYIMHPTISNY